MSKIKKIFYDDNKRVYVTYELIPDRFGEDVAKALMDAFADLTGHYNGRSRGQAWNSFKKFVRYLSLIGFNASVKNLDVVSGFADYLTSIGRLKKTNGAHYNFIKRLISFISESNSDSIWSNQGLIFKDFSREAKCVRDNVLAPEDLKVISDVCRKRISDVRAKFAFREAVRHSNGELQSFSEDIDEKLLNTLIEQEAFGNWTQAQLLDAGFTKLVHSGLRRLYPYRELTIEAALPIYLLLMIQTAANPVSLMEIGTGCVTINPLDEKSITLEWAKNRSSKIQKIGLLREGKYSVESLVRLLTDMTAPIRHLTKPADADFLFITRTGVKAKRLSSQSMHNYLEEFRKANGLPHFTFSDIRRAVAEFVYKRTSSLAEVTKLLQHRDESTTKLYLRSPAIIQSSYERLASFQGQMLELVKVDTEYETVLGFKCAAPQSGTVRGSRKGEPCLEFLSCATCKNAIVVADDPVAVARIIRAKEHLEQMENKSMLDHEDRARFEQVYRPLLNIINRDILEKVSKTVIHNALRLRSTMPDIPVLV